MLIALSIGLLVFGFLFEISIFIFQSFKMQRALQDIQNNANKAIDLLRSEIQNAGFIGCARLNGNFPIRSHTPFTLTLNNKFFGTDSSFTVRYVNFKSKLMEDMHSANQMLVTREHYKKGDILLISDCKKAEIFQVADSHHDHHQEKITIAYPLHDKFIAGAELGFLEINEYFVAKTKHQNEFLNRSSNQNKQFSLFKKDIRGQKMAIIEGLKNMTVHYAILQNHGLIDKSARDIDRFKRVKGVSIALQFLLGDEIRTWYLYSSLPDHAL